MEKQLIELVFDPKNRPVELYCKEGSDKTFVSKLDHEFEFDTLDEAKGRFEFLSNDSQNLL